MGGDDDDSSDTQPAQPSRKNPKRKQVKPQENVNVENNEVDGALDDEEAEELVRPAQADSSDDDEDDDEGLLIALFAKNSTKINILFNFIVCRGRRHFWHS